MEIDEIFRELCAIKDKNPMTQNLLVNQFAEDVKLTNLKNTEDFLVKVDKTKFASVDFKNKANGEIKVTAKNEVKAEEQETVKVTLFTKEGSMETVLATKDVVIKNTTEAPYLIETLRFKDGVTKIEGNDQGKVTKTEIVKALTTGNADKELEVDMIADYSIALVNEKAVKDGFEGTVVFDIIEENQSKTNPSFSFDYKRVATEKDKEAAKTAFLEDLKNKTIDKASVEISQDNITVRFAEDADLASAKAAAKTLVEALKSDIRSGTLTINEKTYELKNVNVEELANDLLGIEDPIKYKAEITNNDYIEFKLVGKVTFEL